MLNEEKCFEPGTKVRIDPRRMTLANVGISGTFDPYKAIGEVLPNLEGFGELQRVWFGDGDPDEEFWYFYPWEMYEVGTTLPAVTERWAVSRGIASAVFELPKFTVVELYRVGKVTDEQYWHTAEYSDETQIVHIHHVPAEYVGLATSATDDAVMAALDVWIGAANPRANRQYIHNGGRK